MSTHTDLPLVLPRDIERKAVQLVAVGCNHHPLFMRGYCHPNHTLCSVGYRQMQNMGCFFVLSPLLG